MAITIGSGTTTHQMTDAEAIKLTSGHDFWSSEAIAGVPPIRMSDGPHGLRYQALAADHLGINEAVEATAFPTASASASSWDVDLLKQMGQAIALEARAMKVDVVLGPGVNIKRNPLGGRNFEYFSEDPLLAGSLGAAWIEGLQANGVGASLKHFAGNNQETARLRSDSLIDATALHELYLEAFRIAVTQAQPETVMIAYNLLNGTYMSDHTYLLDQVLRQQWGFNGLVVSDWGALNDKTTALNAGTDLEMPSSNHLFDRQAVQALATGKLKRSSLTRAVNNIAQVADRQRPTFDGSRPELLQTNAKLAQTIEEQSAVLMKNDGLLPLRAGAQIALIGALARTTRIQGAGSSHITTPQAISIEAGLKAAGHDFEFALGYPLDGADAPQLITKAVATAQAADQVILVLGLPDTAEAEGADRTSMSLPANQLALLDAVAAVNANIVVLLIAGSVVDTTWAKKVHAVLNLFLGGEQVGAAAERLLFGAISPSGKLAETYPLHYADVPSSELFGKQPQSVPYVESLYVGYRYFDKAKLPVAFPFGYGLSYTTFTLSDITLNVGELATTADQVTVSATVTNTGTMRGAEVVQVYVGDTRQNQLAPQRSLATFQKVWLDAGEQATITLTIPRHSFERWDESTQQFVVAGGDWLVSVGTSSRDLIKTLALKVVGPDLVVNAPDWYQAPLGLPKRADFVALTHLSELPVVPPAIPGQFTRLSVPRDMAKYSRIVFKLSKIVIANMQKNDHVTPNSPEGQFLETIVWDTPLIRLAQQSGGSLKLWLVDTLVWLANHGRKRRM